MGLAGAVHPGPIRQLARHAVPGGTGHLPRQGRRRELPAGLRRRIRPAGTAEHHGDLAEQERTAGTSPMRARRCSRLGRWWSPPDRSTSRSSPRSQTSSTPTSTKSHSARYRNPEPLPTRPGAGGRRRELRLPNRAGAVRAPTSVELSAGARIPTIPQRPLGRDVWWWASGARLDQVTVDSRARARGWPDGTSGSGSARGGWPDDHGVRIRPRATAAAGRTVTFADGATAEFDAVIWATGYSHRSLVDRRPRGHRPVRTLIAQTRRHTVARPVHPRPHLAAHPRLRAPRLGRRRRRPPRRPDHLAGRNATTRGRPLQRSTRRRHRHAALGDGGPTSLTSPRRSGVRSDRAASFGACAGLRSVRTASRAKPKFARPVDCGFGAWPT